MPTLEPHRVLLGCRRDVTISGVTNTERMRRLGVALFSAGYTGQERLQILNGSLAYDPNDPNLNNLNSIWVNGGGNAFLVGGCSMTTVQWQRLEDRILNNQTHLGGPTLRYVRLFDIGTPGEDFRLTADHNVPALAPFVGQIVDELDVLALAGLVRGV